MLHEVGKNTVETNTKSKVRSKEIEPIRKNQVEILKLKNTTAKKKKIFFLITKGAQRNGDDKGMNG